MKMMFDSLRAILKFSQVIKLDTHGKNLGRVTLTTTSKSTTWKCKIKYGLTFHRMILNGGWTSLIVRVTFDANKICNSSDHTVIDTHTIIKSLFTKVFSTRIETIIY